MRLIGVDIGTTNLVAAWVDAGGSPRVLYDEAGSALVPATVYFESENVVQVGCDPLRGMPLNLDNLGIQTKRWLGRPRSYTFQGREYSAVELASLMLRKLITQAETRLGETVDAVTLTVPAHFDVAQRAAVQQVAQLTGINLHGIVSEPVAAGLAFRHNQVDHPDSLLGDGTPTLVFDMGGGTLDISVMSCTQDVIDVPVVVGDPKLGGMDFDRAIFYRLCHHVLDETGIDPASKPVLRWGLLAQARRGKESLSYHDEVRIEIPPDWLRGNTCAPLVLGRETADELWGELLDRTERKLLDALSECREQGVQPERLVFSGGNTLVPAVRERVIAHLDGIPVATDQLMGPDEAVAVGAALFGQYYSAKSAPSTHKRPLMHEQLPYDLGVADDVGHLVVIIPKGTPLPGQGNHIFTTVEDQQKEVIFRIVRQDGDGSLIHLGELRLEDLPTTPQGEPDLNVHFEVDAQGALQVTAWEGENHPVKLHVAFSGDLTALQPARRGRQLIVR